MSELPTTLQEFLEACEGKWFSQRTSYRLGQTDEWHQSDKTNVFVELLAADAVEVLQLCHQAGVDGEHVLAAMVSHWEETPLRKTGRNLVVMLKDGRLLRQLAQPAAGVVQGRYVFGEDGSLSLAIAVDSLEAEERFWFAHPNLRLRTSLMRDPASGFDRSSFYSEIRMGAKPAQ